MRKNDLRRARIAAGQPRAVDSQGFYQTRLMLEGRYCETALVVPHSGRILALRGTILTAADAQEIEKISTLRAELVMGLRPSTAFQKTQAQGTGLVDEAGRVY